MNRKHRRADCRIRRPHPRRSCRADASAAARCRGRSPARTAARVRCARPAASETSRVRETADSGWRGRPIAPSYTPESRVNRSSRASVVPRSRSHVGRPGVRAHHVPWRIADRPRRNQRPAAARRPRRRTPRETPAPNGKSGAPRDRVRALEVRVRRRRGRAPRPVRIASASARRPRAARRSRSEPWRRTTDRQRVSTSTCRCRVGSTRRARVPLRGRRRACLRRRLEREANRQCVRDGPLHVPVVEQSEAHWIVGVSPRANRRGCGPCGSHAPSRLSPTRRR